MRTLQHLATQDVLAASVIKLVSNWLLFITIKLTFSPGNSFVDLLKDATDAKFSWDPRTEESFSEFRVKGKKHTVFYPSLSSIQSRLHLAKELGAGISIWEIGQGLDYFYDLL